jgi:hypothetical protein
MTSTVQEPFSRLLPQHILVRPPPLVNCVSAKPCRAGHVTAQRCRSAVPERSRSFSGSQKNFAVEHPKAGPVTLLLLAFPLLAA